MEAPRIDCTWKARHGNRQDGRQQQAKEKEARITGEQSGQDPTGKDRSSSLLQPVSLLEFSFHEGISWWIYLFVTNFKKTSLELLYIFIVVYFVDTLLSTWIVSTFFSSK